MQLPALLALSLGEPLTVLHAAHDAGHAAAAHASRHATASSTHRARVGSHQPRRCCRDPSCCCGPRASQLGPARYRSRASAVAAGRGRHLPPALVAAPQAASQRRAECGGSVLSTRYMGSSQPTVQYRKCRNASHSARCCASGARAVPPAAPAVPAAAAAGGPEKLPRTWPSPPAPPGGVRTEVVHGMRGGSARQGALCRSWVPGDAAGQGRQARLFPHPQQPGEGKQAGTASMPQYATPRASLPPLTRQKGCQQPHGRVHALDTLSGERVRQHRRRTQAAVAPHLWRWEGGHPPERVGWVWARCHACSKIRRHRRCARAWQHSTAQLGSASPAGRHRACCTQPRRVCYARWRPRRSRGCESL